MGCVNHHKRVTCGTDISPKELIFLKQVPGVGPYRLRTLVQYFQGMDAIRRARPAQLMRAEGMDRTCAIGLARLLRSPLKGGRREIGR